jgi:hypothetical protein
MTDAVPTSSPAPVAAIDLSGVILLVSREEVQFLASEPMTEEGPGSTNLITITGLPYATVRDLAKRWGESMPCSIRFG